MNYTLNDTSWVNVSSLVNSNEFTLQRRGKRPCTYCIQATMPDPLYVGDILDAELATLIRSPSSTVWVRAIKSSCMLTVTETQVAVPYKLHNEFSKLNISVYTPPVASDTGQIANIFSMATTGKVVYLEPRTYTVTQLINAIMQSTTVVGVKGLTKITGDFGYAIMRFKGLDNVVFSDIIFETLYESDVEDMGAGVLFTYRHDVSNVWFLRCKFSSPKANTNGLSFYTRINATDTAAKLSNVHIDDCDFEDCGRMGIITLNRSYSTPDAYQSFKGFHVRNSRFKNLGLNGMYGMAISLDGVGQDVTFINCTLYNLVDIGIENTGYRNVTVSDCTFGGFLPDRVWAPFSFSIGASARISDNTISNNRCLEPANSRSNFRGVDDSYFANNFLWASGDYAFHIRDSVRNHFYHDKYKSDTAMAALIGTGDVVTTDNTWDYTIFDTADYAGSSNTVTFDGSGTVNNRIIRGNIRRTAGNWQTASSGAIKNKLEKVALDGIMYESYRIINLIDDNYALNEAHAQWENLRFSGALTATRTIFMPRVDRRYFLHNTTSQTLNITCNGVTFALPASGKIIVSWQSLSDAWYTWTTPS